MKVYLIGYMAVGKTTIGKRLARRLQVAYSDLDTQIELRSKSTIKTIFSEKGEAHFRKLESETLLALADEDMVIATGGGAPCHNNNMDFMLKTGLVVWLQMNQEMIVSRLLQGKAKRPLVAEMNDEDLLDFVKSHLRKREPYYSRANISIDVSNMDSKKMDNLVEMIRGYSK